MCMSEWWLNLGLMGPSICIWIKDDAPLLTLGQLYIDSRGMQKQELLGCCHHFIFLMLEENAAGSCLQHSNTACQRGRCDVMLG